MRPRLSHATIVIVALASSTVRAEGKDAETALDDLDLVRLLNVEVSTATKTAEGIDEAPAVITAVTRDEIQRWGYQTVAEVLQHTVGFYLIDDHILADAGVRGMTGGLGSESGLIKVMIDGRSVAYRTTSGNWLGVELIPVGSIEQIEIIRGPASALYGADAFLGVVNIITVKPDRLRPVRGRLIGGIGSGNPETRADVVAGTTMGPMDVLLGAAAERADRSGLTLPASSPAAILPGGIGERRYTNNLKRESLVLQGRVAYRSKSTGELALSAYGSGIRRGGDFAHWSQLTNMTDAAGRHVGTEIGLQQFRLNLDGVLHVVRSFDLAAQATYFQGGLLASDRIEIGSELFYAERHQSYRGVDTVAEARWMPHARFNLIAGVETVYDKESLSSPERMSRESDQPATDVATRGSGTNVALVNIGSFLSINAKVWDPWLKLTGGLRYDRHSEYGDQVTGRLGATSRLSQSLVFKLLYGSAFKAPSPYLMYAEPLRRGDVIGNTDLKPQIIHTTEAQLSFKPSRFLGVTSSLSQSWLLDKAEFTPQGLNQTAKNIATQRSLSWETRADLRHYDDYRAYASLDMTWSRRETGRVGYAADLVGTTNVVYPPWIARGGAILAIPSVPALPLELGSEVLVVGPRRAATATLLETGRNVVFDPYVMLDVFLATREFYLVRGQESRAALRARNVLGAKGPNPGPAGFEYPLQAAQLFVEFEHVY